MDKYDLPKLYKFNFTFEQKAMNVNHPINRMQEKKIWLLQQIWKKKNWKQFNIQSC